MPVIINDPDDPSPNWGEVRTSHDLPTTGHPFAIADPPESPPPAPSPRAVRPTTRVPPASLPLSLPLLGTKVDAITHWQAAFDAADAQVRRIRKAHEADWQGDVVFARQEVEAERDGGTPAVDGAQPDASQSGWLSGWMAGKDVDQGFARVRLTEEGRARVSDSEGEEDGDERARASVPGAGVASLRKDQWRPSGEAFVTFDSIKSAVRAPSFATSSFALTPTHRNLRPRSCTIPNTRSAARRSRPIRTISFGATWAKARASASSARCSSGPRRPSFCSFGFVSPCVRSRRRNKSYSRSGRSSRRRRGDALVIQRNRTALSLARAPHRGFPDHRRARTNHAAFSSYHHFQRRAAVRVRVALLLAGLQK